MIKPTKTRKRKTDEKIYHLDRTGVRRRNLKHDNGTGMFKRGRIDAGDSLHAEGAHLVAQPQLERGTNVHRQVLLGQFVVTFADVRYNLAHAVLLQRLMLALEGDNQVIVVMRVEHD